MATIRISDLHPTGSELFSDSESYMNELRDDEFGIVSGGATPSIFISISARIAVRSSMRCVNFTVKTLQQPTRFQPIIAATGAFSRWLF